MKKLFIAFMVLLVSMVASARIVPRTENKSYQDSFNMVLDRKTNGTFSWTCTRYYPATNKSENYQADVKINLIFQDIDLEIADSGRQPLFSIHHVDSKGSYKYRADLTTSDDFKDILKMEVFHFDKKIFNVGDLKNPIMQEMFVERNFRVICQF